MAFIDLWGDWVWFAGVALALATSLVSVVYLVAGLLMNEKMKTWAKMELVEIFYSAIIIAVGIGGITTIDTVVQGAFGVSNVGGTISGAGYTPPCGAVTTAWVKTADTGTFGSTQFYQCVDLCAPQSDPTSVAFNPRSVYHNVSSCHMRLGIWYLREIFEEASSYAFDIYQSYIKTSMIAEFTINIEYFTEMAGFFTFTPWKGFFTMGNKIKELVFDWAIKLMMLTKFQEVTLRFIATALFPSLFVMGALMRTFTFTRRLGGLLLAMAIALYFIFPSFYAFGALVMLDLKNGARPAWIDPSNEANPAALSLDPTDHPSDYPDPPVANSMYLRGNIPMLGGNGNYSTGEARRNLTYYEGLDTETYFRLMEEAQQNNLLPAFDLTSTNTPTSAQDQNAALVTSRRAGESWFGNISKESKFDTFIPTAWRVNGPIDTLSRITFWSLFFSLFSIIGTIAAIRSLSITFGGDIEIAGLTRLI